MYLQSPEKKLLQVGYNLYKHVVTQLSLLNLFAKKYHTHSFSSSIQHIVGLRRKTCRKKEDLFQRVERMKIHFRNHIFNVRTFLYNLKTFYLCNGANYFHSKRYLHGTKLKYKFRNLSRNSYSSGLEFIVAISGCIIAKNITEKLHVVYMH